LCALISTRSAKVLPPGATWTPTWRKHDSR
jgi:hypothetical protein